MNDEIMVSICCTAYNHEKYIRKALESFINQKTNFRYEVIVHDDVSTDNTIKIIKEFESKYPDIIRSIYEEENQFSKHRDIISEIIFPKCRGKYIAICEGDDYWCDENKLQKQLDFMENHGDFSMCVHNTIIHDLSNKKKDKMFNNLNSHVLTEDEIFFDWKVHTSSFFIRREFVQVPEQFTKFWFGDFVRLTLGFNYGKIYYMEEIMSVYNKNNTDGVTYKNEHDRDKFKQKYSKIIEYLEQYNEYTNHKYNNVVNKKIDEIRIKILLAIEVFNYNGYKELKKQIKENKYWNTLLLNKKEKIKYYIKMSSYLNYKLFFLIKKIMK